MPSPSKANSTTMYEMLKYFLERKDGKFTCKQGECEAFRVRIGTTYQNLISYNLSDLKTVFPPLIKNNEERIIRIEAMLNGKRIVVSPNGILEIVSPNQHRTGTLSLKAIGSSVCPLSKM